MRATIGVTQAVVLALCALTAATAASGCVEKSKRLSKAEREMAKEIVLPEAPKPQHPLDIRFENKIRLLGYDLGSEEAREGEPFTVTWYWQVNQALGGDWKIFTHLADARRESRINLDATRPLRRIYPASKWKAGDYIKDEQEIVLPDDWDSSQAVFYLGFWNGPHRLHVSKGKNDGDNRAEALALRVAQGPAKKAPELARLIARRATGTITLDGKLDESDWGAAQPTAPFVNTMSGDAGSFTVHARVLYDAEQLYVAFDVEDDYLKSGFEKHDEHLWEQDTVEVMLDPDGDGKNYFEIQVAPTGVVFDTAYDTRRKPQPFGHLDWSSQTKAGVEVRGTLGDDDADEGYTVEMAIPWSAIARPTAPAVPPAAGATWRINFYVMDARQKGQRAVGWSPPLVGDFHVPQRFGRVVFPRAALATTTPAAAAATAQPNGPQPAAAPAAATAEGPPPAPAAPPE